VAALGLKMLDHPSPCRCKTILILLSVEDFCVSQRCFRLSDDLTDNIIDLLEQSRITFTEARLALGEQAKIISDKQVRAVFAELDSRRYPLRDRVMFLLSIKAGMRAVEIASITWAMVTDAEGEIGDVIALQNYASKGKGGGRVRSCQSWHHLQIYRA
jgi:integrase